MRPEYVPPSCGWQEGCILILAAFGALPPDLLKWDITWWQPLIKAANKKLEVPSIK